MDRRYTDDDGRTVADMSGLESRPLFGSRRSDKPRSEENTVTSRPWENHSLSRRERWAAVLGAWKAALIIALAYIAGFGLLIWAMTALLGK